METGLGGIFRSSGELHFGESFAGTGLKVKVDLPDIQRFGLLAGVPLPHIPLQVDAAFSGTRTRLTAEQLQVTSLESEFSGTMEIKNPEHPEIKLSLTSPCSTCGRSCHRPRRPRQTGKSRRPQRQRKRASGIKTHA